MPEVIELFPTLLYKEEIEIPESIISLFPKETFKRNTPNNGWLSRRNFHQDSSYEPLMKIIDQHVEIFIKDIYKMSEDINLQCCGSWINLHKNKTDWAQEHWHPNAMISGVLYLDAPPLSAGITFHSDRSRSHLFGWFFDPKYTEKNRYNSSIATIPVKTGTLLLFPSTLAHSVSINKGNVNRYSFAFDYIPVGTIKTFTNKITITLGD